VVHCLACHAERLRDLAPRPAVRAGVLDLELLELLKALSQLDDRRESPAGLLALRGDSRQLDDAPVQHAAL
jgi:hypothetical protein